MAWMFLGLKEFDYLQDYDSSEDDKPAPTGTLRDHIQKQKRKMAKRSTKSSSSD